MSLRRFPRSSKQLDGLLTQSARREVGPVGPVGPVRLVV